MRGYYGIGVENCKTIHNLGCLWRSAHALGASFVFVIGKRYERQASDTTCAYKHIPLFQYDNTTHFLNNKPKDCQLIGIEMVEVARELSWFVHPERGIYVLGAEDSGLSKALYTRCQHIVTIPSKYCLNVAVAGSIVSYDRMVRTC